MKKRITVVFALSLLVVLSSAACATKEICAQSNKRARHSVEQRTGELEESSRRNTQDIGRLGTDINDVRGRTDRAQSQADAALTRADEAKPARALSRGPSMICAPTSTNTRSRILQP